MGLALKNRGKNKAAVVGTGSQPSGRSKDLSAINFIMSLGEALHRYGTAADRIEEALTLCARQQNIEANLLAAPTSIQATFETRDQSLSRMTRLGDSRTDLGKLVDVDTIMNRWLAGEVGPQRALEMLKDLRARPAAYGLWAQLISSAATAALFAILLRVDGPHVLLSAALGFCIAAVAAFVARSPNSVVFINPIAGFFASAGAIAFNGSGDNAAASAVTVAAILLMLPGTSITTGLRELATGHLTAGTTRLSSALMSLLALALGVAAGHRLVTEPKFGLDWIPQFDVPSFGTAVALSILPLCLLVQFHARPRDILPIAFGSLAAWTGMKGGELLAPDLGIALGALMVGVASNLYARAFDRPASVMQIPGVILLVPGSIGFRSLLSLLERDTISGLEALVTTMTVAASMVFGLLVANVVVAPRKVL
ncbi:MAG: threonine/serine exporter family protein [Planctomycetota bacterium]